MKINDTGRLAALNAYTKNEKVAKPSASGTKTDKVNISGNHFDAKALTGSIAKELSNVPSSRIDAIKASVENGSYNIPADLLADALLGKI